MTTTVNSDSEQIGTLVIASGGTSSTYLSRHAWRNYSSVTLHAPALSNTCTIEDTISDPDDGTPASVNQIQSPPGTDLTLTGGKSVTLSVNGSLPWLGLHVTSGGAEATTRTILVFGGRVPRN